jgi:hypothetical protein
LRFFSPLFLTYLFIYATPKWQAHTFTYSFRGEKLNRYTMSIDASQLKGKLQIRDLAWQRGISVTGWRREFENGLVVVNSSPNPQEFKGIRGYRRILGTQAPGHNNGQKVDGQIKVDPWDAHLLIRE